MELFEALKVSRDEFGRRLALVGDSDWHRATPCSEWDVQAVAMHVTGGCERAAMLLHGASAADVQAAMAQYVGGHSPGSFQEAADAMMAALAEPGALSRTVHHPAGDRSGQVLAGMRVAEFAVHGWDLARAMGADETMDPDVAEWLSAMVSGMSADTAMSKGGYFQAPEGEVPAGATPQDRLLHLLGRSP